MSKYKPGQLVTIRNHVFRIVRKKDPRPYMLICAECGLNCVGRIWLFCNTIPRNCYLKPVK